MDKRSLSFNKMTSGWGLITNLDQFSIRSVESVSSLWQMPTCLMQLQNWGSSRENKVGKFYFCIDKTAVILAYHVGNGREFLLY